MVVPVKPDKTYPVYIFDQEEDRALWYCRETEDRLMFGYEDADLPKAARVLFDIREFNIVPPELQDQARATFYRELAKMFAAAADSLETGHV